MRAIDNQVIIVGAGPVGLTAAMRLNAFGIPCTVLEKGRDIPDDLRASTFHPPTLDMLDAYGFADGLLAQGRICPSWQIRMHDTHEKAEFDLSLLKDVTRHPYRLQVEQFRLCILIRDALLSAPNVEMRFGAEVTGLAQDGNGVRVTIGGEDSADVVTGRYLIAADGARSRIREQLGFTFEGVTYPETTVLATTRFPFEEHLPGLSNVNYIWAKDGTFSLLHLPNKWRCSLYPDKGQSYDDLMKPEVVNAKMQRIVPRDQPYDVIDVRDYRVHMRIAQTYRRGRVLLAGDAAHINSPSGGMGMNGGVHDAFALTEALQKVWNGEGDAHLDAYSSIRQAIAAEDILKQADKNRARMQERDPQRRREMFEALQKTANDPDLAREHLLRSSMIAGLEKAAKAAA